MIRARFLFWAFFALFVGACSDISYVQRESPNQPYKDYEERSASIIGRGEPISKRQMRANATMSLRGEKPLEDVMGRVASTFNVAIRWGSGVRRQKHERVLANDLTFDELRTYIEDVYDIQIIREGERRLLVLPAADVQRIEKFEPGINVRLSQVVRGLAEICDFNIVFSENKEKLASTRITTSLSDVTCYDAFDAVLNPYGLSLEDKGDFYLVSGFPSRTWRVNLYEPLRDEEVEVSYQSEFGASGGEEGGSSQSLGGTMRTTVSVKRDLWEELETDLNELINKSCEHSIATSGGGDSSSVLPPPSLDGEEGTGAQQQESASSGSSRGSFQCGYVRINRTVGVVQMRAPASVLDQANDLISYVEDIASRRLMVEARVLAVTRERDFEQGVNLQTGDEFAQFGAGTPNADTNQAGGLTFQPAVNSIAGTISGRLASFANDSGGFLFFQNNNLDAVVNMIEQYGTTYQLMQPVMEVMDRQRAVLIDGRNEKFFIIEQEEETTETGTTETTTATERTQFVGLQFSAVAQIGEEGDPHTVALQVPITEIVGNTTVPDGSGSIVPIVSTRLIDQKVRIRDGEIKVIGGLTKTIAVDRENGVPVFRETPLFGKALNEEDISYEKVEFIVLLQARRLY